MQDGVLEHAVNEETLTDLEETAEAVEGSGAFGGPIVSAPPAKRKKKRKKAPIIILVVVVFIIAALVVALIKWSGKEEPTEIVHDTVMRGSVASIVEGNGITKAKNSESITVTTSGTVMDVYVSEGEFVTQGTVLYLIDSPAAQEAVTKGQKDVEGYQKQLRSLYEAQANLDIKADFTGKLIEAAEPQVGELISDGQLLGRLVDDSKMKLTQYYSYAYENDIYAGQAAQISVPAVMEQRSGTVTEVKKIDRISPEGSRLFRVEITLDNPGTLSEKMAASAVISANGEQISPYEQGELEFNRSIEVKSKVSGEVEWTGLVDYMKVDEGQSLLRVRGDDNSNEIFNLEENLKKAQDDLEKAQENRDNLQGTAPIDGTVMGLAITPGEDIEANTAVISITDATQILVEANVDERSISTVKAGDAVDLDQWGNVTVGTVQTVSLNGKFENGMTTFPVTIVVDNADNMLMSGSGITYKLSAKESSDCLLLPLQSVKSVSDPETGEAVNAVFVKSETPPEGALEIDGTALGVPAEGYYAVKVELGISDNVNVEILSGVEEGMEVFSQVMNQNAGF